MIFSIAFFPFKMLPKLVRYLFRRAISSFTRSREIHRISLRRREGLLRLAIALALAGFIAWQLLRYDLKTGILFSFSSCLAIYSGLIYKSRMAIVLVLVGAIMGALAFTLVPYLDRSVRGGDWIGLGAYLLIMLFIWLWSSWLKRVKVPDEWKEEEPRKRTPVKRQEQTVQKTPARTIAKTPARTIEKAPASSSGKTSAKTPEQTPTKAQGKTTQKTPAKITKSETNHT